MAIYSTGAISFQDLINEFKAPKPVSLSQMYAGGGYVPEANAGVPKSGAISLGNFYGATAALVIDYDITADMFNFNSDTVLASYNWDGATPVILTVNIATGIVVSGDNTSTPAFVVNALPNGSQVIINNNGYIIGMGGRGGEYANGGGGGAALFTNTPLQVTNNGTIGGGGGGGGYAHGTAAGGGGRSGRKNSGVSGQGNPGQGTFSGAGVGGYGGNGNIGYYRGGAGGNWGAAGQSVPSRGAGGSGGAAVVGNSLIHWVSEGTIMGSRIN